MIFNLMKLRFMEGSAHHVFCPELDLVGYGDTPELADEMFQSVYDEWKTQVLLLVQ